MSYTLWFTGLSGSGKTTLAKMIVEQYKRNKKPVLHLDGDEIRELINTDLRYSIEEREEHLKRIIRIAMLANRNDIPVIVSTISPTKKIRDFARNSLKYYIEVYTKCPIDICKERDPKGLYKKKTKSMVGVDIKYEEPKNPHIILETDKESYDDCIKKIMGYLEEKNDTFV